MEKALLNSFYEASRTQIPKHNKYIGKKENDPYPNEFICKILTRILAN